MSFAEPCTSEELSAHYKAVRTRLLTVQRSMPPKPVIKWRVPAFVPPAELAEIAEYAAKWKDINNRLFGGRITPKSVIYVTAAYFELPVSVVYTHSRKMVSILPRQAAIYIITQICRQLRFTGRSDKGTKSLVKFSYPQIGHHFGVDHSTVIHSIAKACERMEKNAEYKKAVEDIIELLRR